MNDRVKLLAYRILDPVKGEPTAGIKEKRQPQTDTQAKPDPKPSPQPADNVTSEPEANTPTPSAPTPQLVKRVHQFYEALGREDVQAVQDWEAAEQNPSKEEPRK